MLDGIYTRIHMYDLALSTVDFVTSRILFRSQTRDILETHGSLKRLIIQATFQ